MKKKPLLIVAVVLIITTLIVTWIVPNTPEKNKQIEYQAYQDKNPSECSKIKGNSYNFGPTDARESISQTTARQQCRDKIKNNIEPALWGG